MNRLAPLISRSPEPARAWAGRAPSPPRSAAAAAVQAAGWTDDLRLFATAWLGGVVFFGTLIA